MTEDDRLKKSFDYVRKACFPKWDYVLNGPQNSIQAYLLRENV